MTDFDRQAEINPDIIGLTTDIVSAYVSNNPISPSDLPGLISDVHSSIAAISAPNESEAPKAEPAKPAVSIKKSITPDYLICLEDGKKFKSLKRHLITHFNMTPEEYRAKWGLPSDYPMVAPNYSAYRSKLAVKAGLGRKAS